MTEFECYCKLYGEWVYWVEHYGFGRGKCEIRCECQYPSMACGWEEKSEGLDIKEGWL
jgi:hypothetical protein